MFSLQIVDTDAFLDMPHSSQLLYFHLSMRADDDGFVSNPKKIMRTVGSQEDDYKVLLAKRFIIPFDNGVCVIKHWRINNYIRNDRYKETVYEDEKKQLRIKKNGAYTDSEENVGIPISNRSDTEKRIEKNRKEKKKVKKKKNSADKPLSFQEFYKRCLESERRDIRIIGEYADEKKIRYTTHGQWQQFTKRNLRAAQQLKVYSDTQISSAMNRIKQDLKENNPKGFLTKWSLETVIKYLE